MLFRRKFVDVRKHWACKPEKMVTVPGHGSMPFEKNLNEDRDQAIPQSWIVSFRVGRKYQVVLQEDAPTETGDSGRSKRQSQSKRKVKLVGAKKMPGWRSFATKTVSFTL